MLHVLVDIDETALSVPKGVNAWTSNVMFKEVFGIDAHEEMVENAGKTEMGIIHEVLELHGIRRDVPEEAYRVWGDSTIEGLSKNKPVVLPGIPELLTELSKKLGIQLGLLTGNSTMRAEEKLKSVNLDNFFRDPNTKKMIGVFGEMAPKRDMLFDIIKQQAIPEDRFVIIDDSLIAARMAQKHQIPIILVATGKATEEELRAFSPHVFPDFGGNRWREVALLISEMFS